MRWYLRLLLLAVAACPHWAHAQATPIVQCQIGSWVQTMPDFVCRGIVAGSEKILPGRRAGPDPFGLLDCAAVADRYVDDPIRRMEGVCQQVWGAMLRDRVAGRR